MRFYVFAQLTSGAPTIFEAFNADDSGGASLIAVTFDGFNFVFDAGAGTSSNVPGSAGWNTIELAWTGGGSMDYWVNADATVAAATGSVQAAAGSMESVVLGTADSFGGTLTFDDYEARQTGPIGPICAPTADAGADRTSATGNAVNINTESVLLGGSPAGSGGTPPYTYQWTISPLTGFALSADIVPNPVFTGTSLGTFTAELEVTDGNGLRGADSAQIDVVCPPQLDVFNALLIGSESLEATDTVTLEQVLIGTGAEVTVVAGQRVIVLEGLHVEQGATLSIVLDPGADCDP